MKKLLLIIPVAMLLAAGCDSSVSGTGDQNPPASSNQTNDSKNTPAPADNMKKDGSATGSSNQKAGDSMMTGNDIKGTLEATNNPAKGNYMIMVNGHMLYIHTSRDFSALVGKSVNVSYTGDMNSFVVKDIMSANDSVMMQKTK